MNSDDYAFKMSGLRVMINLGNYIEIYEFLCSPKSRLLADLDSISKNKFKVVVVSLALVLLDCFNRKEMK